MCNFLGLDLQDIFLAFPCQTKVESLICILSVHTSIIVEFLLLICGYKHKWLNHVNLSVAISLRSLLSYFVVLFNQQYLLILSAT